MEELATAIGQYGFPIIAAGGLGYFILYIWRWVTEEVGPVISESHMTLIALIDRVRMLDNDLIRLQTKLNMILQQQEEKGERYDKVGTELASTSDTSNDSTESDSTG